MLKSGCFCRDIEAEPKKIHLLSVTMTLWSVRPVSLGIFIYTVFIPNLIKLKVTTCHCASHQVPSYLPIMKFTLFIDYLGVSETFAIVDHQLFMETFFSLGTMTCHHGTSCPISPVAPSSISLLMLTGLSIFRPLPSVFSPS